MNKFFKSIIGKCFLYTLLYICFSAISYSIIWWVSYDFYWWVEMLESSFGRGALVQMTLLNLLGGYIFYIIAIDYAE